MLTLVATILFPPPPTLARTGTTGCGAASTPAATSGVPRTDPGAGGVLVGPAANGTSVSRAATPNATTTGPGAVLIKEPWAGHFGDLDSLTAVGDHLFFSATDGIHGQELWVSDGAGPGTRMVRDIRPGPGRSMPQGLARFGDRLLFSAYDDRYGRELWVSDGTRAGTHIVRDIRTGAADSRPEGMTTLGNVAYFAAVDRTHGWGLWRTDGTNGGTRLVHAVGPTGGNRITGLTAMDDGIYFFADTQLWRTDGMSGGTRSLTSSMGADIQASAIDTAVLGHRLYVSVSAGTTSGCVSTEMARLIRTDGTRAGTRTLLHNVDGGSYWNLTPFRGRLYFIAVAEQGRQRIWVSSGSASTTHVVRPKLFTGEASMLTAAAGRMYFTTQGGYQLWSTDGSAGGERQLVASHGWDWFIPSESQPGERIDIATLGGRAWFPAAVEYTVPGGDGGTRGDVWSSDGTAAGTHQETSLDPVGSSSAWALVPFRGDLYFSGSTGSGGSSRDGLWKVTT